MNRKNFLLTTLTAIPALAFTKITPNDKPKKKAFKVENEKDRFNERLFFKGKHTNDVKISGKDTDGQLAMFEYTGFEKTGPSMHLHLKQDEIFYVVEGEYRFVVGEETMHLKTGETIFLPRNVPHTWIQLTDKGKMIYLVQPAGKMEDFFKAMSKFKTRPSEEQSKKIHEEHDMRTIGPGLSL